MILTAPEKRLLHLVQTAFPLTPRPYHALAAALGVGEDDVIEMLQAFKDRHLLREIRAIFEARQLGFELALIGFEMPADHLAEAAQIVNAHPGVSHNYQREHRLNLWFTLAVPHSFDIRAHAETLAQRCACANWLFLPGTAMHKRKAQFAIQGAEGEQWQAAQSVAPSAATMLASASLSRELQHAIMCALQHDLPLTTTPFAEMARQFAISEATLFAFIAELHARGVMSRFAGLLKHRNLGFTANAMVVWEISPDIVPAFVATVLQDRAVSHCYERVTSPAWPYNMYTMLHGAERVQTDRLIAALAAQFGLTAYETLYSAKEYKKQMIDYFSADFAAWHARYVSEAVFEK